MMTKEKLINQVVDGFQQLKGKASIYCFTPTVIPDIVYKVITLYHAKHPDAKIFIGVDGYNTRQGITKILNANNINKDTGYNINILSQDYIKVNYNYTYDFTITVGINDNLALIQHLRSNSKFTLCILTKNIMDINFIDYVRKLLPPIATADFTTAINAERIYSPVEETRVGVELSDNDRKLYDKYTDYINLSVSIFGDLSSIEKCKVGDIKNNISASDFRYQLALNNGWNDHLDTSVPFMRQIDDVYNPNTLYDRACNFYNITKQRRDLITDNKSKLDAIVNIITNNTDKQILIISKRSEYAKIITKYINEHTNVRCADYHDCIDDGYIFDEKYGLPILVKSGINKGTPKIFKSQALSTHHEKQFNTKIVNCLSIKNASDNKLKIAPNIMILTTCLYDNIIDVKTRFTNISFDNPTIVYRLYCKNTIEQVMLNKEKVMPNVKIVNSEDENFVMYDENLGSIVL